MGGRQFEHRPGKVRQIEEHHRVRRLNVWRAESVLLSLQLFLERRVGLGIMMALMLSMAVIICIREESTPMCMAVIRGNFQRLPCAHANIVVIQPCHLRPRHRDQREEKDAKVGGGLFHNGSSKGQRSTPVNPALTMRRFPVAVCSTLFSRSSSITLPRPAGPLPTPPSGHTGAISPPSFALAPSAAWGPQGIA